MTIDKDTMAAVRAEAGARVKDRCSRFTTFNIDDVAVPEDLSSIVFAQAFDCVSLSGDGIHWVDLDPVKLRWLYLEAVDRGWYDA